MIRVILLASACSLLLHTGCGDGADKPGSVAEDDTGPDDGPDNTDETDGELSDELDRVNSCFDLEMYAFNGERTRLLTLWTDGLLEEAHAEGAPITRDFTIPDAALTRLDIEVGADLGYDACSDAYYGGDDVQDTYAAISGSLSLTVTPDLDNTATLETPALVEATFTDLQLENVAGDTIAITSLTITGSGGVSIP